MKIVMREITFRAWDSVDKKYYFEIETTNYFDEMFFNSRRYIVEQYTGIKDRNGVEIYEGDIVKVVSQYWGQLGNKYEVTFESGAFLVPTTTLYDIKGSVVVIGNIHENADLLEETT